MFRVQKQTACIRPGHAIARTAAYQIRGPGADRQKSTQLGRKSGSTPLIHPPPAWFGGARLSSAAADFFRRHVLDVAGDPAAVGERVRRTCRYGSLLDLLGSGGAQLLCLRLAPPTVGRRPCMAVNHLLESSAAISARTTASNGAKSSCIVFHTIDLTTLSYRCRYIFPASLISRHGNSGCLSRSSSGRRRLASDMISSARVTAKKCSRLERLVRQAFGEVAG